MIKAYCYTCEHDTHHALQNIHESDLNIVPVAVYTCTECGMKHYRPFYSAKPNFEALNHDNENKGTGHA